LSRGAYRQGGFFEMAARRSAKAWPAIAGFCVAAGALLLPIHAIGQAPGGRTIFRCESAGHVSYTDAPCPDAEKVDPVRLRGINPPAAPDRMAYAPNGSTAAPGRSSARERVAPRTARFAPAANAECPHLAQRMALVAAEEQVANAHDMGLIQERLAVQRHWFQQLGCAAFADAPAPAGSIQSSEPHAPRDYTG
jgi:hypothetical protein